MCSHVSGCTVCVPFVCLRIVSSAKAFFCKTRLCGGDYLISLSGSALWPWGKAWWAWLFASIGVQFASLNKHACAQHTEWLWTQLKAVKKEVSKVNSTWDFFGGRYWKMSQFTLSPNFLSCACRECGLCLSVGLVKFNFMGNILSPELCEEKIDYPEKLSKQERKRVELNVSEFLYGPTGPNIVWLLQRVFTEMYIHLLNSVLFILYTQEREKEKGLHAWWQSCFFM